MNNIAPESFNEVFPFGTLPHERLSWLIDYYNDLEKKRLQAWEMIAEVKDEIEKHNLPLDMTPMLNSSATYEGEVLKITVNDYIPRKCLMLAKGAASTLRFHWLKAIVEPIRSLQATGVDIKFKKAFCIIKCYVPRDISKDVDNVAYKVILDGLRYAKVINDDSWKQMSFMVDGDIDRKNPRTEIMVIDYSKINTILESVIPKNYPV